MSTAAASSDPVRRETDEHPDEPAAARYITRKVTEHDVLRALERGLENAPLSFAFTDGQVAHLARSAATAREKRIRRELRQGRPIRVT